MGFTNDLKKTISYAGRNGVRAAWYAAKERLEQKHKVHYRYEAPWESELAVQRRDWKRLESGEEPEEVFRFKPKVKKAPGFSILVPAYKPDEKFFRALLDSVMAQTYGGFELIIADAGDGLQIPEILKDYPDERIHYHHLDANGGISANTNAAATFAQKEYVAFLDHDDLLTPDALYENAVAVLRGDPEILYSDEDKCDRNGRNCFDLNRKPDFNQDYFFANNYICHLLVMRRELFLALKLRSQFDGAQDFDLMLRAPKSGIYHIPKVLYHWRSHEQSTSGNPESKTYAYEAGKRALEDYFAAREMQVKIEHSKHLGFYSISYRPDIFSVRKEVGVVGGKVVNRKRKIIGGIMDADGNVLYEGMHEMDSGAMHRADTAQDAWAVDVRSMQIRPELSGLYREIFGAPYDEHIMQSGDHLKEKSIQFCRMAAEMGYLIVWDPKMVKTAEN